MNYENDSQVERRLGDEARKTCLGTLGDRSGVNVAKVEVSWCYEDPGLGHFTRIEEHAGHYIVHATGEEPMIAEEGEYGSIYTVFETLVHEAMQARQKRLGFADYAIDDISSY